MELSGAGCMTKERNLPIQIRVLLAAHVLLLMGASWLCAMLPPASLLGFILSSVFPIQVCLIGVWLGMGKGAPRFFAGAEAVTGPAAGLLLLGTVWGTVTLTVVWATLGRQRPHERIVLAMVLAFFGGLIPPYYFGEHWRSHDLWWFALTTLAMSVVMAGSLLVVRSVGYRFVRHVK